VIKQSDFSSGYPTIKRDSHHQAFVEYLYQGRNQPEKKRRGISFGRRGTNVVGVSPTAAGDGGRNPRKKSIFIMQNPVLSCILGSKNERGLPLIPQPTNRVWQERHELAQRGPGRSPGRKRI